MARIGARRIAGEGLPSRLIRDPPQVTITAPIGTVGTSTVTVNWTYLSALGRPQVAYRIVLWSGSGQVFDTGLIPGAATSHMLDYQLSPFVAYKLFVGVNDGIEGGLDPLFFSSGWDMVEFFTEFAASAAYPEHPDVGSVYEIGINGVGYMLDDRPGQETRYQRRTVQLSPERLATGNTPFSEAIDRYTYIAHSDWTAGSGQTYLNRAGSDPSQYFYSEWINPFEEGEVRCLPTPQQHISSAYTNILAVVAGGAVYAQTGNNQLTHVATPGGATTAFSPLSGGTISDLATDGIFWYATNGTNIQRHNAAADPGADWSAVAVTEIEWCSDRLAGLDTAAAVPNFTTFTPTGTEEVPSGREAFDGATLKGICGGDGYIWWGVNRGDTGEIRAWNVGGGGTSSIGLTLPAGESVNNLFFYLGNVFIAAKTTDDRIRIYRSFPSDGKLTPQFIVAYETYGFFTKQVQFAGLDRFVAFSWYTMLREPESGIGVIDLESGGYARWQAAGGGDGFFGEKVTAVVRWQGDFAFTISAGAAGGLYGVDPTPVLHAGFLETSVSDLATNVVKTLDKVSVTTQPLNGTVEVSYSTSTNESFTSLGTMSGSGITATEFPTSIYGSSFGFRMVLTPTGSEGPVVKLLSAQTHPLGLTDQLVILPVNAYDQRKGLNDQPLPSNGRGRGRQIARLLESMVGQDVLLQDVDWPDEPSNTYQVVSAELDNEVGIYDRHLSGPNRRVQGCVINLTLRRPLS